MPGLTLNSNPTEEERFLAQRRMRGLSDAVFGLPDILNTGINAGIRDVGHFTGLYDPNTAYQLPMASQSAANLATEMTGADIVPHEAVSPGTQQSGANQQALMGMIPTGGVEDVAKPTLGILAGIGAKYAPYGGLRQAKNMYRHQDNSNKIWQDTGWENDLAGQWTWEIPDIAAQFGDTSKISMDENNPSRMGDVLFHPQLFANYPALKDIGITRIDPSDKSNTLGSFNPDTGDIGIRFDPTGNVNFDRQIDPKGTVIHELQHAVQKMEGWEPGMNQSMIHNTIGNRGQWADTLARAALPLYMQPWGLNPFDPDDLNKFINSIGWQNLAKQISNEGYLRSFGEAQARNAHYRSLAPNEIGLQRIAPSLTIDKGYDPRSADELLTQEELLTNPNWDIADFSAVLDDLTGPVYGPAEARRKRRGLTLTSKP